jgi:hypothetical protein
MGYIRCRPSSRCRSSFARPQGSSSEEEHADLIVYLASHPEAGAEIVGTGGVRKVRFAARGKGKSGGVRVIYYFYDRDVPLFALYIYGKSDQADLTPEQRKAATAFATAIKAARRAN